MDRLMSRQFEAMDRQFDDMSRRVGQATQMPHEPRVRHSHRMRACRPASADQPGRIQRGALLAAALRYGKGGQAWAGVRPGRTARRPNLSAHPGPRADMMGAPNVQVERREEAGPGMYRYYERIQITSGTGARSRAGAPLSMQRPAVA
jgi:hypothetical protein